MSIFKKLLVVLLTVALPPLIFVSALDRRAAEALSRDLIADYRAAQITRAGSELQHIVRSNGRTLTRERELVEYALRAQAAVPWQPLESLPKPQGHVVLRRYTVLDSGTVVATANTGIADDVADAPWIEAARGRDAPVWTLRPGGILTAAMATADGAGVAAVDLAVAAILDRLALPEGWAGEAAAMLADPNTGEVLARRGTGIRRLDDLMTETDVGTRQVSLDDTDMLLAHGPAGGYGLRLALALPLDRVLARTAASEARADKRLARQVTIGGVSVAVFAIVAVILSFIGSRAITRPVVKLTETARRIAAGDLEARADVHTGDELEDLSDTFNAMVPALQDRFQMREALGLAMEVQQHLLPVAPPQLPGFDIAGRSIYCDETGGDYYDFIEVPEPGCQRIGIAVGDVTGHGVAAALLMTTARALLRSHADTPGGLSALMGVINTHLSEDTHAGRFMTLFYGVLEAPGGRFRWVSAGHEPAILFDPRAGTFTELAGADIPLGIDGTWRYHEDQRATWVPGEILTIGTDGIWESRNPEGEMFGKERLNAVVRKYADHPAEDICDAIARSVRSFRKDAAQQDDITLVVIKATA